ncbi:hypothetical protein [Streptomyces ardesiacus]|uniref:hypothetical protein n=1 Tax=Streptomyces ardesiacus TaxID=285564 RepID=UPI002FDC6E0F
MGFREPTSNIVIRFEQGDELHGLEATVRGMTIGEWLQSTGMDGSEGDNAAGTINRFCSNLLSWNLEDATGQPVPVSEAPNRDQKLIRRLSNAYVQTLMGVHKADPLPDSSTSGENSPAPAIPMAPLSESQAS